MGAVSVLCSGGTRNASLVVLQEYLWLRAPLKNAEYKKPIAYFLRAHGFPNAWNTKQGFSAKPNEAAGSTTIGAPDVNSIVAAARAAVYELHQVELAAGRHGGDAGRDGAGASRDYWAGFCSGTTEERGDCAAGEKGFLGLPVESRGSWEKPERVCLEQCAACSGCRFVSLSLRLSDCSWYRTCPLERLPNDQKGFRTLRAWPAAGAQPAHDHLYI